MTLNASHISACMETWLQCEELLVDLTQKKASFSTRTTRVLDECAHICFGVLQSLRMPGHNAQQLALLCIGICEECAEICERYTDKAFRACADTCRQCSTLLTPVATAGL